MDLICVSAQDWTVPSTSWCWPLSSIHISSPRPYCPLSPFCVTSALGNNPQPSVQSLLSQHNQEAQLQIALSFWQMLSKLLWPRWQDIQKQILSLPLDLAESKIPTQLFIPPSLVYKTQALVGCRWMPKEETQRERERERERERKRERENWARLGREKKQLNWRSWLA